MSIHRNKKLGSIIRDPSLKPLIDQANKLKNVTKRLQHFLPSPLSEHVIASNIKGNTLILQADSPAWSTRTNFIATDIINYMRSEGGLAMVERLKVKVIPPKTQVEESLRSVEPMSDSTSELLKSVAANVDDNNLADVLKRLASHSKKGHKE